MRSPFEVSVAGVTFRSDYPSNVWALSAQLVMGPVPVTLVREPDNEFDNNAIKVVVRDEQVGYIPSSVSKQLAKEIDSGGRWHGVVDRVLMSPNNPEQPGIRIKVFEIEQVERQSC